MDHGQLCCWDIKSLVQNNLIGVVDFMSATLNNVVVAKHKCEHPRQIIILD